MNVMNPMYIHTYSPIQCFKFKIFLYKTWEILVLQIQKSVFFFKNIVNTYIYTYTLLKTILFRSLRICISSYIGVPLVSIKLKII